MTILKAENISKQYRLGTVGTKSLQHDLNRWYHMARGKEDPYLKIGAVNDRSKVADGEYVWALKDINFEVQQGEVLGIIGKNGAGKSTLLKILSRVTSPTTGSIKTKGRIASLLEVGTGFHPELTGRENIFLNGAILGMSKTEIAAKLDEIIDFSGCQMYIDTPTKRYSSGMTVRLAFAVAAFLEPDILVVDEVLAVGDAEFQKKAIGKMQDISQGEGRTVLFVSHNMFSVQSLCTRGILLENGAVTFTGNVETCIFKYLNQTKNPNKLSEIENRIGNGKLKFEKVTITGKKSESILVTGEPLNIEVIFENQNKIAANRMVFDFGVEDDLGNRVGWVSTSIHQPTYDAMPNVIRVAFPKNTFNEGHYYLTLYCTVDGECADWIDNAIEFSIGKGNFYGNGRSVPSRHCKIVHDFEIQYDKSI
jgi:lipopolysaccharide transport system ATP-binding protein